MGNRMAHIYCIPNEEHFSQCLLVCILLICELLSRFNQVYLLECNKSLRAWFQHQKLKQQSVVENALLIWRLYKDAEGSQSQEHYINVSNDDRHSSKQPNSGMQYNCNASQYFKSRSRRDNRVFSSYSPSPLMVLNSNVHVWSQALHMGWLNIDSVSPAITTSPAHQIYKRQKGGGTMLRCILCCWWDFRGWNNLLAFTLNQRKSMAERWGPCKGDLHSLSQCQTPKHHVSVL